jgi:hypothetical protein
MEQLSRLILGNKVVGYEKHVSLASIEVLSGHLVANEKQINKNISIFHSEDGFVWCDIDILCLDPGAVNWRMYFIQHNRKDLWTGYEDKNKRKMFDRDCVRVPNEYEDFNAIVEWCDGGFELKDSPDWDHSELSWWLPEHMEITGIDGVKE